MKLSDHELDKKKAKNVTFRPSLTISKKSLVVSHFKRKLWKMTGFNETRMTRWKKFKTLPCSEKLKTFWTFNEFRLQGFQTVSHLCNYRLLHTGRPWLWVLECLRQEMGSIWCEFLFCEIWLWPFLLIRKCRTILSVLLLLEKHSKLSFTRCCGLIYQHFSSFLFSDIWPRLRLAVLKVNFVVVFVLVW